MSDFRSTSEWKRGDKAQREAADLLRLGAYYVIPSYDYSGGEDERAPRLEGLHDAFPVPDLDCAQEAVGRIWVEVKTKSHASWSTKDHQWQHGFNARLYRSYLEVGRITKTPVYILIHEEGPAWRCREVRQCAKYGPCPHPADLQPIAWQAASLAKVTANICHRESRHMVKNGRREAEMIYFPRDILRPTFAHQRTA